MLSRSPSPVDNPPENHTACSHYGSTTELNHCGANKCDKLHNQKHLFVPSCNSHVNSRIKQSCCMQKAEVQIQNCGCRRDDGDYIDNPHHSCDLRHKMSNECSAGSSHNHNHQVRHACQNYPSAAVGEDCRHNTSCHHRLTGQHEIEEPCEHTAKRRRCHLPEVNNCHSRVESSCCPETPEVSRIFSKNKSY